MKNGYVRVVLTTNFDRLLEQALAEAAANLRRAARNVAEAIRIGRDLGK